MKIKVLALVLIALTSCSNVNDSNTNIDNSDSLESKSSITKTMTLDYGNYIENYATLLFGETIPFFNINDYGIDKLYAGDTIKISYTGDLNFQETYPSRAVLDGKITNIKLTPALKINFEVTQALGGGYEIVSEDGIYNYSFPKYYVAGDNSFHLISSLYDGLKFIGTVSNDKQDGTLDGLYAIDFDASKITNLNKDKSIDEKLNDYCNNLSSMFNEKESKDYYYSIRGNNYVIESQKIADVEYFVCGDENNNTLKYKTINNEVKLYANGIIYDEKLADYKAFKNNQLEKFLLLLKHDIPLKNKSIYNGYEYSFYQIDPCCGGPAYLNLTSDDEEIEFHCTYNIYDFIKIDENDYLTFNEYVNEAKNVAKEIYFSNNYSLLEEINISEISANYIYEPGFGTFKFYDKKYKDDNNIVFYESYSFPDCYFSINQCITRIFISDKEFAFNDLTLNNNRQQIIKKYQNLGFVLNNPISVNYTSDDNVSHTRIIYSLSKKGIIINLIVIDNNPHSIEFLTLSTNIYKITY